jgi:hypothetical protein
MAEAKQRLDAVQAALAPFLERRDFRKSGRTFRRSREPGLVQVINLQAGMHVIQPAPHTADLYGRFTVNLGIAIAELYELQMGKPFNERVQEHECGIRARLGDFLEGAPDTWWDLAREPEEVAQEVMGLLVDYGLPFLDRFDTRAAVREQWVSYNESEVSLNHLPRMTVALLELARGDRAAAQALLENQIRCTTNPRVKDAMRRLASQHGIGPLDES